MNYDQIVNELWEAALQNFIRQITFGMLEQSHNTVQKSYTLREACHYKREFGGRIYAIQQEIEKEEETSMGNTYYILNTTNRNRLVNGFRFKRIVATSIS